MAATPKFGAEDAKKIEQDIVQAVEVSGADAVAAAIGKPVKFVQSLLEKGLSTKTGQQLVKGVQDLDKKLLDLRVKPLERIGAKAAIGGGEPPKVSSDFAAEQIRAKGETGYQVSGQPGGSVATTQRPGPLVKLGDKLAASEIVYDPVTKAPMSSETAVVPFGTTIQRPVASATEIAEAARQAKPRPAGQGVSELTPEAKVARGEESRLQAERAADLGLNMDLSLTPSPESMRKAGKLAAGTAAAGGLTMAGITGMKLFGDRPLSQQDYVGDTTRVAEITATPDIKAMTDKAMPHVPEQAKEIIQNQVQKVLSLEERLDKELSSARAKYDKEVARKEMLQAIETVMHGLVTALGAKAALDRGSPFAIDFSKGPQVNWESKFANLQKDFELQTNSIVKKYDLEQKERLEQQKAEESKRRYEERMGLEREKLGVEKTKVEQQLAKQQAEDVAKLNAADQKQYQNNVKNFALLKEAIQNKKAGDVVQYATLLGADDQTIDELNKGKFDRILSWVKGEKSVDDILQGLKPQKPTPAAAPVDNMVTVTVNGQTGRIPRDQLEAFKKQYPNAEVQ